MGPDDAYGLHGIVDEEIIVAKTTKPRTAKPKRPKPTDPTALGRRFRRALNAGGVLLGGIVTEHLRPSLVKIYCCAGFDFVFIENEHPLLSGAALADFIQCARDNRMPVISKVGQLDRAEIARVLDAGAIGVQLPRTESHQDVRGLVEYLRYPPEGSRAAAPILGNVDYQPPSDDARWLRQANRAAFAVAHIETRRGYENAEEIISTPGLDMVYVGPYDFSIAMGHPGKYDHPAVKKALFEILAICRRHNVPFGTTAGALATARELVRKGCRFFEVADELSLLADAAGRAVDEYRRLS